MKSYSICNLADGSYCNPVDISGLMRNLKILRANDCATLVEGEKRDSFDGPWTHFRDYVGNSLKVYPISEPQKVEKQEKEPEIPKEKGFRGRKKIEVDICFPDGEFKMKDLLASHPGISQPVMYLRVQDAIKNNQIKEVRREKIDGQRGKAPVVYSKVK